MKITRETIPVGRENAVTRSRLCELTGASDREVRRQISQLRSEKSEDDMVIVSVSRNRGYYRTDNPEEIAHFIAEMRKRIRATRYAIKTAEAALAHIRAKQAHFEELGT